jgi:hypothetical protein
VVTEIRCLNMHTHLRQGFVCGVGWRRAKFCKRKLDTRDELLAHILSAAARIEWVGLRGRYSDWLLPGPSGDRIPVGGEIFRTCLYRPWGPPSLLYNGYRVFPGGKERPERDADPLPFSSALVKERVELCFYSPCGPYCLYRASVLLRA